MITVRVVDSRGNERVLDQILALPVISVDAMRAAWFELGEALTRRAHREIVYGAKSGRVYKRSRRRGRRIEHQASAPGESHAEITGKARRSIGWKVTGAHRMDFGYGVSGSGRHRAPAYAKYLEHGTSRMGRRPSLENAIDATQRDVSRFFNAAFRRSLAA